MGSDLAASATKVIVLPVEDLPVMALLAAGADTSEIARALGLEAREAGRRASRVIGLLQAGSDSRTDAAGQMGPRPHRRAAPAERS